MSFLGFRIFRTTNIEYVQVTDPTKQRHAANAIQNIMGIRQQSTPLLMSVELHAVKACAVCPPVGLHTHNNLVHSNPRVVDDCVQRM